MTALTPLLERALDARQALRDPRFEAAYRLFAGFYEGFPELAVDLYGRSVVVHDYAEAPENSEPVLAEVEAFVRAKLPEVRALVVKNRKTEDEAGRRGVLRFGTTKELDRKVRENDVWYAIDLLLNRDASLYLDTRNLRTWARSNLAGKKVLNTFAYTGSLGVAARAAPASRVVQTDLNRAFLNLAKTSYALNGWPVAKSDFKSGDFFEKISELKKAGELFDCVVVDPPFFSQTAKGTVDLENEFARVINKVRPLVGHEGWLVAVNNALFVSGADFERQLQALCADGYLRVEGRIDVPQDFTGFPATVQGAPPVDPAPYNHATKIALLRAKRKDERLA